jgi:hypothetical protein
LIVNDEIVRSSRAFGVGVLSGDSFDLILGIHPRDAAFRVFGKIEATIVVEAGADTTCFGQDYSEFFGLWIVLVELLAFDIGDVEGRAVPGRSVGENEIGRDEFEFGAGLDEGAGEGSEGEKEGEED